LIAHTLVPKLKMLIRNRVIQNEDEDFYDCPGELDDVEIHGSEYLNKCYVINQQPIGRAKTSNIATLRFDSSIVFLDDALAYIILSQTDRDVMTFVTDWLNLSG